MTRLKLDENLPSRAALTLRQAGHDVSTALDEGLGGASDTALANACADEDRILLTLDLDFADIRAYGSPDSPGIVVLRVPRQGVASICGLLERSAQELGETSIRGGIWILEPRRIRRWRVRD